MIIQYCIIILSIFFMVFLSVAIFEEFTGIDFDPDFTPHFITIMAPVLIITGVMIELIVNKKSFKEIFSCNKIKK